ncbi:flippase-like domain-containing protein [Candidatus Daviesbacteria bacterium]|nr:flippase-like domain-containing protein [Candidatus Daviesbacteria bacterium]
MLKILFNTVLGVALIFIWSRFVNINEIFQAISKISPLNLTPVFLCMFLSPFFRAVRLQIFLSEIKKIKLLDLIFLNGAAQMLNFFIPIRAGELAKGVYLNNKYNLPLAKSIVWVFMDRFVDFLFVLLFASLLVAVVPTKLPAGFAQTSLIIFVMVAVATYLVIFQINFSKKLVQFLQSLLIVKTIKIYFVRFSNFILDSFTILKRHPKDLSLMFLITLLAYGADAGVWYFTFLALKFPQEYVKMYLGQLLSALTYLVPAAPGYVGSTEASGLLILSGIFGIENNVASSMIVLFHIVTALGILVFGLISAFFLKLDLGLIFKKALKRN